MSLRLTSRAEARVLEYLQRRGSGLGLRVGVTETGCSGYSYVLDYADEVGSDDVVLRQNDLNIVVSRESLPLLEGTEVDFVQKDLNEQFVFTNPNATGECGCGESFTV
ncbi:MAG: iron-sulfur cluster assembly accessory protein [Gammaproteobacteria bacterium]|jgi:iron-sulfur cluster assembly protein|nr:iron-sulfur cluster assembly accessory protein [Gammaproteobacteria bacterium]MCY3816749.1 iron-sulfur cluster assembly accessory protein [Gammaproteobacteria bacterium]MDE0488254.1 iron-sulfur cluster assembly accessory protein [Gammaproteobacteria bacterium]MXW20178.1 iron-sulfur cluster assembly accessory protein [Gammaproteobacteria bacterium]MXZ26729.1 iron-sulfur cluster assembly accessory protein [Gammaproteobacteria bacterium]